MRDADKLPYLTQRLRAYLHRLERVEARVAGGAAGGEVAVGELTGDAPSVRAAVAELVEGEAAAARGEGIDGGDPDLALTLWLMAQCGDDAFAGLPGWGGASAPLMAPAWPPPPELSPDLGEQVEALLADEVPDPHRAELYLLAVAAGAGEIDDGGDTVARLAAAAAVGRSGAPATPASPLFPAAYPPPRRHGPPREVPPVARWVATCVGVVAGLLLTSWLIWAWAVGDLERLLHQLLGSGG